MGFENPSSPSPLSFDPEPSCRADYPIPFGRLRALGFAGVMLLAASTLTGQRIPLPDSPVSQGIGSGVPSMARTGAVADEVRLAGNYMTGRGVKKDAAQAAYWYRKAADHGDPEAQNQLGYLYSWGIGVDRDEGQAVRWFTRGAGGGSQIAKLNLAVMYIRGQGVSRDEKFGAELVTELAERGNAHAQDYLGLLYYSGIGVPQDDAAAEKWFAKAAKGKSPEGQFSMGTLYSIDPRHQHDFVKAAGFLRASAKGGYVPAMHSLAVILLNHREVQQKGRDEALTMLRRAAEAGTWRASATMGFLLRDGNWMPRETAAAFRWLTIAGRQGGPEAEDFVRNDLGRCRDALTAAQQQEQEDLAGRWLEQHLHVKIGRAHV